MKYPKVVFKPMSLEENIDIIKWSFYAEQTDLNVHDYTIKYFEELRNLDIKTPKEEGYKEIEKVVTNYYEKNKDIMMREVKRYQTLWEEYNDKYLFMLSNYLGVEFAKTVREIKATVGFIPVCPRNLDDYSFAISMWIENSKVIEIAAHEILHFLWFEKWRELYPKSPKRHFDFPYIEWKYSEMVTDPILNNKPFNELFAFKERGYDSFYELYDKEELVMDILRSIYSTNDEINIKIKKGYQYILNYFAKNNRLL